MARTRARQGSLFPDATMSLPSLSRIASERLPTNTTTHRHPIHRWFNFVAGFSPEFVELCLVSRDIATHSTLLDPFAGCATAPLVAAQLGMNAIGYEPHPILSRIARAKFPDENALKQVDRIQPAIQTGLLAPVPVDILAASPRMFLSKLFALETLESLLGARESLRRSEMLDDDLAFVILSKMLDKCSHSKTDGIYKAPTSRKSCVSPAVALQETCRKVRADLAECDAHLASHCRIFEKSACSMEDVSTGSIDIVVTSPPYLNNFDFAEMTRMLLYFWGVANSWREITDTVRAKLVINTTTALTKEHKHRQAEYRDNVPVAIRGRCDDLVAQLNAERQLRPGKKEYNLLVYPYFSQLTDVLRECYRCMATGASFHMMVSDAAFYGIHVSAPQLISEVLSFLGFADADCSLVRKRGHRWILDKRDGSSTGLGEYHVRATRP